MLLYNKVIMGIREEQNMGNYTNEKGLVVVQDNFLTKIKNFFAFCGVGVSKKCKIISR